jgi:hypothetical protein
MAIAATAATEFDAKDIDQLHTAEDVKKPEFMKLVEKLRLIKSQNENVMFAYIDRPTGLENPAWEVVADADYGTPDKDLNGDGIIEEWEQLTIPGQRYLGEDPYHRERLKKPIADIARDEWGEYFDTSAPIFDSEGKAVAALFVDIDIEQLHELTGRPYIWFFSFLGFFFLFVFIRLAAFNRSLFQELLKLLKSRAVFISLLICSLVALGITYGMYIYTLNLMKEEVGTRLMSIAATAAPEIDARDLEALHTVEDMKKEEYQRVFRKLNEIRERNRNVTWVYILRQTKDPNIWEFVADADSNYYIPRLEKDINGDGLINDADANIVPGERYDASGQEMADEGMSATSYEWVNDQWGPTLTAYAPIMKSDGKAIASLGVDASVAAFREEIRGKFAPAFWFLSIFLILILAWLIGLVVWVKVERKPS